MPTYTGICNYGELYSVLKQRFLEAGWAVDDRTGQDVGYTLAVNDTRLWAVDSLYVYAKAGGSTGAGGRVISKNSRSIAVNLPISGSGTVLLSSVSRTGTYVAFFINQTLAVTAQVPAVPSPYSFDTSQDTGIYFDDYYFIPTYSSITMYYGGLYCTSPAGVTAGIIKTPYGLLLRPASLVPPYNSTAIGDHWPVQYLLKIEDTHVVIALQGIYQFDTSALTAIGYTGLMKDDAGNPAGVAAVSTHQHPQQTQRAAVTNTVADPDLPAYYIVQPATLLTSPNYDTDFMLSSLGLYRNGEGTRGTLRDIYACNIQAGTILNGETVTAPDGKKYSFFNVPTSQAFSAGGSGFSWYNGFHQNFGAWLAIRH
ncbi:hypothetical protein MTAT_04680 [Moorella thermoacetica]|uniref:Uncharacterized protein n=1 Tax=Neomoorella thermoacetica TaxID=1525 RepID=A0AAC9MUF1_NEOTH|nr:hypothetical protein [Moorella thermoacetica]AOQ24733.1 hypothetical protein Maut_02305 [Moorella thermoacetica]TYL15729.1 hypothetical protein MTAT_04680 [Moorella thermoacetica]